MAQRVSIQIVSDLSGDEVAEGKGDTIPFSYRGVDYSIDLTDKEAAGFDKAIAMYVSHATKVSGRRKPATATGPKHSKEELANIRAWAKENGHEVSERGRIAQATVDAYHAAN